MKWYCRIVAACEYPDLMNLPLHVLPIQGFCLIIMTIDNWQSSNGVIIIVILSIPPKPKLI